MYNFDASFLRFSLSALSFAYFWEFCDFGCAAHCCLQVVQHYKKDDLKGKKLSKKARYAPDRLATNT